MYSKARVFILDSIGYFMESEKNRQRQFILYCSLAGFISAWAISGLLVIVDVISGTPAGTFFAVIGISLGFSDPVEAQYIGFLLHVITGATAGNIFGQLSFTFSAPNQYIYNIAGHFQGLYPIIIGGSLVFHLAYGALAGFLSGRMVEIGMFMRTRNNPVLNP